QVHEQQQGRNDRSHRRLDDRTEAQAGERDAELAAGEIQIQSSLDSQRQARPTTLFRQYFQPARPRADGGKLGGDEKAVQRHQCERCEDAKDDVPPSAYFSRNRDYLARRARMSSTSPLGRPSSEAICPTSRPSSAKA